jgi:hypothetical protein
MKAKKATVVSSSPKDKWQSDSSLVSATPQQIVARLAHVLAQIDRLPLPIGQAGCHLLDALELAAQIREKVREKARELLTEDPRGIANWYLQDGAYVRELGQHTAREVWERIEDDSGLSLEDFLRCCRPGLIALENAIQCAADPLEPHQARALVNRLLGDLLTTRQNAASLRRRKEQPQLEQERVK